MEGSFKYCGVILAAGRGSRIKPLSFSYPKPMLPVCNKPIIQYQLENMIDLGIKEVFIVCSQLREAFEKYFQDGHELGISIRYVEQEEPLGIAHALAKAEQYVKTPFLLMLGDILFITKDLHKMLDLFEKREACGILAVKQESNPEYIRRNFAVLLHESKLVKRVVEKPRYIPNSLKGCGIYFFDLPIFDAVRRTPRTAMRDEYEITSSIQMLIDDGYPVYSAEVIEWDMNITVVDDLILSNLKMLDFYNKDNEVERDVRLHPGSKIIHSVIGDGVVVDHPVTIRDSMIMPGTRVTTQNVLSLEYPEELLEIVVVSDGSTDRTNEIVSKVKDARLALKAFSERSGKTACLNRVIPEATGDVVLFTDANAMFHSNILSKLVRSFYDPAVGLVTGWTKYVQAGEGQEATGAYSKLEKMTKYWESLISSCAGADGAIFAIRKSFYRPLDNEDINDFVTPLHVVSQGKRVVLDPEVFCIEAPTRGDTNEYRRQARITNRTLRAIFKNPGLLNPVRYGLFSFFLLSHKLLRFLVPFFAAGVFITNLFLLKTSLIYIAFVLVQLLFLCLGLANLIG